MADAAPFICVALVAVVLVIGWVLGRRRRSGQRNRDLVGELMAVREVRAASGRPPMEVPSDIEHQLRTLLVRRQKIQAIKLLREYTGVGLKDAKDAVDRLDAGQPLWLAGWGPPQVPAADLDLVRALKRQGRVIEAIKTYRALTGVGLKEAKDAVDQL